MERPCMKDHACWADGNQALIKKARNEMFLKISQDPSCSINQIYEEVRNSITQTMESQEKLLFLELVEGCGFPPSNIDVTYLNKISIYYF